MVLVKKEDYKECREKDAMDTYYNGPTILDLIETGDYYFICDIGKHCEAGQKFHITVVKKKGSSGNPFPFQLNNRALAAPITSNKY